MFDTRKSQDGNRFRRGVFCTIADEFVNKNEIKISDFLSENYNLMAYKLVCDDNDGQFKLVASMCRNPESESQVSSEDTEFSLQLVDRSELRDDDIPEDQTSPIFFRSDISPLFHDYKTARHILEQLSGVPEVKELIDTTDKYVTTGPVSSIDQNLVHPFIVVEGMDATGKTTLTEELEKRMGAVRYFTPPSSICSLRAFFDKCPEIVRRAYYSMGNYIVARDIIKECQTRPVIMDRFWHSTAAYGIANETSLEDMPGVNHTVYRWPEDLLKPTIVLFLTVSEDVRKQRLSGRGINPTFEEKSLDKDQLFRKRLCESYRHMREPSCVEIDAGGTVEDVRNMALEVLKSSGVKLNNMEST
ncbi:UMP kinase [Mactra antiquata]